MRSIVAGLLLGFGLATVVHAADCLDGDYAVVGDPLLPSSAGGSFPDVVTIDAATVAVASGCPATPARIRRTSRGTVVRATWRECGAVARRVRLRAVVSPACRAMRGVFASRRPRIVRRFTALRSEPPCDPATMPCPCGGIAGVACPAGEFCELPTGECRVADAQGTCVPVPQGCPDVYQPVCGCDGVTYGNDCDRQAAEAQKAHEGVCAPAPDACGGTAGVACPAKQFCELPEGECHGADLQGVCLPVPEVCPELWAPVCGCDGVTYSSDCDRRQAGVQRAHDGPCGAPCASACDCAKEPFPVWCSALACPACDCVWTCDAGRCAVAVGIPTDPPACAEAAPSR